MEELRRRANEAVELHAEYLEGCTANTAKARIEDPILDVTADAADPRYGHGPYFYGEYKTFQGWVGHEANRARTFTSTAELWTEVKHTIEMLYEEGLDHLPLTPEMLPAPAGFFVAPYGIENLAFDGRPDEDLPTSDPGIGLRMSYGGDRHMVDGFMWFVTDKCSVDGFAGKPTNGIVVFPLTRWRDRREDRPFKFGRESEKPPGIVASDMTAWAFDRPGQNEWAKPPGYAEASDSDQRSMSNWILWTRSLVWATLRWLTEEIETVERPDRPIRRRMQRIKTDDLPLDGDVTIVKLRTERSEAIRNAPEGEPPWWRTRWIVHGHWARRRYAIRDEEGNTVGPVRGPQSIEGVTFEYRHVWIDSFEKGPENAPLVVRDAVGVLAQ